LKKSFFGNRETFIRYLLCGTYYKAFKEYREQGTGNRAQIIMMGEVREGVEGEEWVEGGEKTSR
jgi:hypothetical protein